MIKRDKKRVLELRAALKKLEPLYAKVQRLTPVSPQSRALS